MDKQTRNFSFDFIRAIGVTAIFLCHFLSGYDPFLGCLDNAYGGGNLFISKYLGSTFNVVFITISAILFGLKYEKDNYRGFSPKKFMLKRTTKIASSLYPFLAIMFIIYWLLDVKFNIKDIIMNFAFLSWFDKQPAIGHLWFITMIMACYIMFVILSGIKYNIKTSIWIIIFIIGIGVNYFAQIKELPAGYSLLYLTISCYLFLNASKFIQFSEQISLKIYTPIFITVNIITIILQFHNIHNDMETVHYLSGCICGITWMIFLFKISKHIKHRSVYVYLSAISYEIYLVHHPLCFSINGYSIRNITDNPYYAFIIIATLSILFAIALNSASKKITQYI